MPWWGWLIVAALAMAAVYGTVALVFFAKTSKRVFSTFDDTRATFDILDKDVPLSDPFFTSSVADRVKRMTGSRPFPPKL